MKFLTPEFGLLIWTLLAFLIVFFILKKLAWTAIIKGSAATGSRALPIHWQQQKK